LCKIAECFHSSEKYNQVLDLEISATLR